MFGTLALVAAVLFLVLTLYRLVAAAPTGTRFFALGLADLAGALGLIHWINVLDTRWMVGGVLLLAAGLPLLTPRVSRAMAVGGLVLGLLGTGLYGIAAVTGSRPITAQR